MSNLRQQIKRKISPINLDSVVFTSFNGRYSDSPKAISEKLHELAPEIPIIWLVTADQLKSVPIYAKAIDINSRSGEEARNKARVRIDNVFCDVSTNLNNTDLKSLLLFALKTYLKTKKTQRRYTTWHGTPLKMMGRDQIGNTTIGFSCPNTTLLLGNVFTKNVMERITYGVVPVRILGSPRNDLLFNVTSKDITVKKTELGLPTNKKVLLFAPTFRSDGEINNDNVFRSGINQLELMDVPKLLDAFSERFSSEWVLVCRFHYHVDAKINWEDIAVRYNGSILNGNSFPDMSDYLLCADALITDASSCMFDYLLTGKPCFLFFPDLENYTKVERGTYFDIDELPFSCSQSFENLLNSVANFDEVTFASKCNSFLNRIGNADDGHASERVVEMIIHDFER